MSSAIVLFALSLLVGFALGRFSWRAIAASSLVLAVVAAVVLHRDGFGALAGIAVIMTCLTINQTAYLAGVWFLDHHLVQKQASRHPGQSSNEDVGGKNQQKQRSPSATAS